MSKLIKIQKPRLAEDLDNINDIYNEIILSDKLDYKIIENELIEDKDDAGFTIDCCKFKNVIFSNCKLNNIDLLDTVFENCDLSNIDFNGGSIHRVEFINCKLLGAKFDDSSIKDVLFKDCLGKYSSFSFSKLKGVNIIGCNLQESSFQNVKFERTAFEDTNLIEGYFNQASLNKIDFTSCDITGLNVNIPDVNGIIVSPVQALDLTRLLNITIK